MFSKPYLIYSGIAAAVSLMGAGVWVAQHGPGLVGGGDRQALVERVAALEKELESARQSRQELMQQLAQAQASVQTAEAERARLQQERQALEARSTTFETERQRLSEELATLQVEKQQLEGTLRQVEDDTYVGRLLREKAELEVKAQRLELVDQLEKDRAMLETEVSRQRAVADKLAGELAVARRDQQAAQEQAQSVTREYETLRLRLAALEADHAAVRQERDALAGQLARVRQDLDAKSAMLEATQHQWAQGQRQVVDLQRQKEELAVQANRLRQSAVGLAPPELATTRGGAVTSGAAPSGTAAASGAGSAAVQLAPIVVAGVSGSAPAAPWEREVEPAMPPTVPLPVVAASAAGQVVTVNQQHNFLVIDLGQEHGVAVGKEFTVLRDGRSVGLIRVIEVRKRIAAADILSGAGRVAVGDTVAPR